VDSALEVVWFGLGLVLVGVVVDSAVRTFVLPRGSIVFLTRLVWLTVRRAFDLVARPCKTYEGRDRVMALYAPLCLLILPVVWLVMVIVAYMLMFHGLGVSSWRVAFTESGSSLLTLGFVRPTNLPTTALAFSEAALGLGLLALLISYLPSIYGVFSRREVHVAQLSARAGTPPSPVDLFVRVHRIGRLEELEDIWITWQYWFAELEETHTSQAALVFLRSPRHDRSWITAAGCLLDTASLYLSTVDVERSPDAALCVRAGWTALHAIADFFSIPYDPDPQQNDPTSIAREEYDDVCRQLQEAGVPLKPDRDQTWLDFNGWRVNYDAALIGLCSLTMAPYALWSSDRSLARGRSRLPPLLRRRR
jgi:hypothetical protein